jgi:hypothetical protein
MTTITITLPDDLAKQAEEKGLLSSTALAHILGEALKGGGQDWEPVSLESTVAYPPDFDPRLVGAVNPLAFKRGTIVGDVVSPLEVAWEVNS